MADFGLFKLTNAGLELEMKAQTGKVLNFTKFKLGDGNYSGDIETLTDLINPIRNEEIKRLSINTISTTKHVQIGFDIDTSTITTGFYLREIGIFAEDPDTQEEVLMFYGNSGDTADYIAPSTSSTLSEKLIDILLYISNVENITAVIDSSMVYVSKSEFDSYKATTNAILATKADNKLTWTTTIDTTWTGASAPYTKTIALTDMLATYVPILDLIYSSNTATALSEKEEFSKISKIESGAGEITLTCFEDKPTISLNTRIEVVF